MAYQEVTQRQLDFIEKIIMKKYNLNAMRILKDKDMTRQEISKIHPFLKMDKFVYLLGIARKYKDDNGIYYYGLTKRGRELARAADTFLIEINNLLPPGE